MRKLLAYGVIQSGRLVERITITEKGLYASHTPGKESPLVKESHMVPVMRNGVVIGYQDLFGSDTTIYNLVKGGE